jgi:hypothetical protein
MHSKLAALMNCNQNLYFSFRLPNLAYVRNHARLSACPCQAIFATPNL